jgi:hypothetical protein
MDEAVSALGVSIRSGTEFIEAAAQDSGVAMLLSVTTWLL